MNSSARVLGIDIGGTKIAAGVVELPSAKIIDKRIVATNPRRGPRAVLNEVVALAASLCAGNAPVAAIGAGMCELVTNDGQLASACTLDWPGHTLRKALQTVAPAAVESDARTAARAEAVLGAGKPFDPFVYVTIGTGISFSLVIGGKPFSGARGLAISIASGPVASVCERCGHAHEYVLEQVSGGPGLAAQYNRRAGAQVARAEEVLLAASNGDGRALDSIEHCAMLLGSGIACLVSTLDPAAVILGGGLGSADTLYRKRVEHHTRLRVFPQSIAGLPILPAALGPDAGILGAALCAPALLP
jgi:glucokinase